MALNQDTHCGYGEVHLWAESRGTMEQPGTWRPILGQIPVLPVSSCVASDKMTMPPINDFFFLFFFRAQVRHMEVPSLGVESELQLPAYTTATATQDHSLRQRWILNPTEQGQESNPNPPGY